MGLQGFRIVASVTVPRPQNTPETTDLRETVRLEKNRRRRGKPLFDDLGVENDGGAMFFSPSKIQRARDRQKEKEQERDLLQAQKKENKHQKQLAKEEKQLLTAQRKAGREEQRLQRLKEKAEKQAIQAEAQKQRIVDRQLRLELENDQKQEKKRRQALKSKQMVENEAIEVPEQEGSEIRTSRFGRQLRTAKQFDF
ncbi:hypothetical protein MMC32_000408 [Xylographa parallela]|nr:hypothetical protein [Xylographa parallela]